MNTVKNTMHLSLNVQNLEETIHFYNQFFGETPAKTKPGYAKYMLEQPALVISFIEKPGQSRSLTGHLGIQVQSMTDLKQHLQRVKASGLNMLEENQTRCCYALQDKFWVEDPDGYPWEIYFVHEDTEMNDPEYTLDQNHQKANSCC